MVLALKIEYVVFIVFGVVFVGCACISKMRGKKKNNWYKLCVV